MNLNNEYTGDITGLAEIMDITDTNGNRVFGISLDGEYSVSMEVYRDSSVYGINKGRISRLNISDIGRYCDPVILCNYHRGWDIKPMDEVYVLYRQIMERVK